MKIKKYAGGSVFTYLPTTNRRGEAAQQAASSGSAENNFLAKEIIKIVQQNGLESDVNAFLSAANTILNPGFDPLGQNYTMAQVLDLLQVANKVKSNYTDYEKTRASLESEDAWNDVATTRDGYMIVMDVNSGEIENIAPNKFDPEKYQALKNSDVMSMRQNNPNMAFNMNILNDLSAASGVKTVMEYIHKTINEFGSSSITGYSEKKANEIQSGLEALEHVTPEMLGVMLISGPDGKYKIKTKLPNSDSDIRSALEYIWTSLPKSYKNTLTANSVIDGMTPEAYIVQALSLNSDREVSADFDSTATTTAGGLGGGAEGVTTNSYIDRIMQERLPDTQVYISPNHSDARDSSMIITQAWRIGQPATEDGKGFSERMNIRELKAKSEVLSKASLSDNITFGNQLVDGVDLDKIIWDGESEFSLVLLPWTTERGKIKPDFTCVEKFNKLSRWISENNPTALEVNQRIANEFPGGNVEYKDGRLEYKPGTTRKFITFSGIANDKVYKIEEQTKPYSIRLDANAGKMLLEPYQYVMNYGTEHPTKGMKSNKTANKLKSWNDNDFYQANVYVPLADAIGALHADRRGEYVPKSDYMQVYEKAKVNEMNRYNQNNPGQTLVGQFSE